MKKLYLILCLITVLSINAQRNHGTVNYIIVSVDTIHNKIIKQDSMYSSFVFKKNMTKWEMGISNLSELTKTIVNDNDYYVLNYHINKNTGLHGKMPKNGIKELLNYTDTSLHVIRTDITKIIAGRTCKKMILQFSYFKLPVMVLWYDEHIDCKSIIPGAGSDGKCITGLILEYEMMQPFGKTIITANNLNFDNVDDSEFVPNLKDYVIEELNSN